ncbi:MAG: hypothetical protein HEP71_33230 [Roseivirga sp.]|nr:hypothetical protein [Roseivirga sp.]
MPDYKFHDNHLGLSDEGIHLLRNGYNYKTLDFKEIGRVEIKKGNALKNRLVLLIIGLGMIGFSIFFVVRLISLFNSDAYFRISIQEILIPLFPFLLGSYCLYAIAKKETILKINGPKTQKFSLSSFEKNGELESLKAYLKTKTTVHTS